MEDDKSFWTPFLWEEGVSSVFSVFSFPLFWFYRWFSNKCRTQTDGSDDDDERRGSERKLLIPGEIGLVCFYSSRLYDGDVIILLFVVLPFYDRLLLGQVGLAGGTGC